MDKVCFGLTNHYEKQILPGNGNFDLGILMMSIDLLYFYKLDSDFHPHLWIILNLDFGETTQISLFTCLLTLFYMVISAYLLH